MSSSSESSGEQGSGPLDGQRYSAVTTVISRRVSDGVIARRWDVGAPPVVLNDSAWAVLQAVMAAEGSIDAASVVTVVSVSAGVDPGTVGDLVPVLELLVASKLVASVRR